MANRHYGMKSPYVYRLLTLAYYVSLRVDVFPRVWTREAATSTSRGREATRRVREITSSVKPYNWVSGPWLTVYSLVIIMLCIGIYCSIVVRQFLYNKHLTIHGCLKIWNLFLMFNRIILLICFTFAHSFDILGFALLTAREIFLTLLCSLVRYSWLCFAHSFDILGFALLTREIFLALLCSLVRYPLLCSDVRYPLLCSLVRYPEGIKSQSGVNFVNYKLKGQYFRPFSSRLSTSPKITLWFPSSIRLFECLTQLYATCYKIFNLFLHVLNYLQLSSQQMALIKCFFSGFKINLLPKSEDMIDSGNTTTSKSVVAIFSVCDYLQRQSGSKTERISQSEH